nr:Morn repeat domain containing protein [Pandoravirus aubagnensis]
MDDLPDELVLAILAAAESPQVAGRMALASRRYRSLAMDETLWRAIYIRQFGLPTLLPDSGPTAAATEYQFQPNKGWRWNFMARTPAARPSCTGMLSLDRATYWGDIVDGQPHGYGTLVQPPHAHPTEDTRKRCAYIMARDPCAMLKCMSLYKGGWADGKRHGHGKALWSDGTRYEGDWAYDRCDGQGTMVCANRNRYKGGWSAGQRHGHGSYSTVDWIMGDAHVEGNFVAGRCVGDATVRLGHQTTWTGTVVDGSFLGPVVVACGDGARAIATFSARGLDGPYLLTDRDGSSFSCQYDGSGDSGGHGTMILADGRRRDGNWYGCNARGTGIVTYPDGSQWAGEWTRDGIRSVASGATVTHAPPGNRERPCACSACTDDDLGGGFDDCNYALCHEPSRVFAAIRDSCKPE